VSDILGSRQTDSQPHGTRISSRFHGSKIFSEPAKCDLSNSPSTGKTPFFMCTGAHIYVHGSLDFWIMSSLLSTCIRKYGHVFITWFIHSMYAKV